LGDFEAPDINARLFIIYVQICQFLGDIVEHCLRRQLLPNHQRVLENALYRWAKQDLPSLGMHQPSSLEIRQVMVTYFATLVIIDRTPTADGFPSARALIAASFIVGIFRVFLEQEELCRLGPAFTFYALCAGLALIPAYRFLPLRHVASEEMLVLKASLQVLSQQWGSAFGSLRALQKLTEDASKQPIFDTGIPHLADDVIPFFEDFDSSMCKLWDMLRRDNVSGVTPVNAQLTIPSVAAQQRYSSSGLSVLNQESLRIPGDDLDMLSGNWEGLGFDWGGSWLLESM
jgi:hypothetical protein